MKIYVYLFAFVLASIIPAMRSESGSIDECYREEVNTMILRERAIEKKKQFLLCQINEYTSYDENISFLKDDGVDYERYIEVLGKAESNNNYKVVNQYGYIGKYQFGSRTLSQLKKLGLLNYTNKNDFRDSEIMQEAAMSSLTAHNLEILKNYKVDKYVGKEIGGIKITKEGLLAASHLRGPNAVRLYLNSNGNVNLTDANDTSVRDYMKMFS